jgi:hypothetical protein
MIATLELRELLRFGVLKELRFHIASAQMVTKVVKI